LASAVRNPRQQVSGSAGVRTPRKSCDGPGCGGRTNRRRDGGEDRPAASVRSPACTRFRLRARASTSGLRCPAPRDLAPRLETHVAVCCPCAVLRPGTCIGSQLRRMDRLPRRRVWSPDRVESNRLKGPAACVAPHPEAPLDPAPVALPLHVPNGASAPRGRACRRARCERFLASC
jgi:hypothetical protein